MTFIKNFIDWFKIKPKLNDIPKRLLFKEAEIWYMHIGVNIGFEIDGKKDALRPCLIVKKMSKEMFYAIPLTSKKKNGSWYYPSHMNNSEGRYILSQMRVFDAKRLKYCAETISQKEFHKVKAQFIEFFNL